MELAPGQGCLSRDPKFSPPGQGGEPRISIQDDVGHVGALVLLGGQTLLNPFGSRTSWLD